MTHTLFKTPTHTIGEFVNAVLAIHDKDQAREFFDEYVAWSMAHSTDLRYRTEQGAAQLARSNIGWCFGEGMPAEDIAMWVEACGAAHPVLGATLGALAAAGRDAARRIAADRDRSSVRRSPSERIDRRPYG